MATPNAPMRMQGKVALVTGAGAGIGQAIALRFASEGAKLVACSRAPDEVAATVERIRSMGGEALGVVADVADAAAVARLFDAARQAYGRIDVVVNNAGIMDDFTPAADVSDALWRRVLGVNLDGVFHGCREALATMLAQGSGAIINIASIGGLQGGRAGAAYTASKHAVIGLTKNIGYTYAKTGVRCNAIAPGGVATSIGQKMKPHPLGYERMSAGLGNNVRIGQPDEIATIAVFLATEASSYVNGAVLTADGGWTAY